MTSLDLSRDMSGFLCGRFVFFTIYFTYVAQASLTSFACVSMQMAVSLQYWLGLVDLSPHEALPEELEKVL